MESEIGKVIEVRVAGARVEVTRTGMCAHCGAASNCIPAFGANRIIEVADPLGVSVGQRVRIELSGGELVRASLLAYMAPLVAFFIGAALGFYAGGSSMLELSVGVGAVAGLALGFGLSRRLGRILVSRGKMTPTITAIMTSDDNKENL